MLCICYESLLFWKQILNCVFSTSVFSILIVFELPSLLCICYESLLFWKQILYCVFSTSKMIHSSYTFDSNGIIMLLLVLRYMILNKFFKLNHLNLQKGFLVLRELIIFVILSPRTRIQRIHTILIVFELPSL